MAIPNNASVPGSGTFLAGGKPMGCECGGLSKCLGRSMTCPVPSGGSGSRQPGVLPEFELGPMPFQAWVLSERFTPPHLLDGGELNGELNGDDPGWLLSEPNAPESIPIILNPAPLLTGRKLMNRPCPESKHSAHSLAACLRSTFESRHSSGTALAVPVTDKARHAIATERPMFINCGSRPKMST